MIDRANPRARAALLVTLVVLVVIGMTTFAFADDFRTVLINWVKRDPALTRARANTVSLALAAVVVLPLFGMAVYLWRFSVRVLRADRFPPRDAWLIVDTPVLEGADARGRGRLLQAAAFGLAASALLFLVVFSRLILSTNR